MEETNLLQRLKAGDKTAFTELVELYSSRVINTCYKFVLDREDAEDISQEVFIEVYQSIKSFRGDAKLSTWIYRIAVTKSLDEIKKRNRKKRITSFAKMIKLDDVAHWIGGGAMPDKSIHENERMKEVMQALNTLPDSQRVAFILSKIDGYTSTEIAEIMKTTVYAVESLISRAKRKVSDELRMILKDTR
ncbi:MAG: sigma-70 family RNA polymerase sigma factor [Bacteroidetes bacterium]|nr:sigma-70 family RNA polymerase sigma factor [Bacteroidota bacterium]